MLPLDEGLIRLWELESTSKLSTGSFFPAMTCGQWWSGRVAYAGVLRLLASTCPPPSPLQRNSPRFLSPSFLSFSFHVPFQSHISSAPASTVSCSLLTLSLIHLSNFSPSPPVLLLSDSVVKLVLGSEEGAKQQHCLPVSQQDKNNDCNYIHIAGMLHLNLKRNIQSKSDSDFIFSHNYINN